MFNKDHKSWYDLTYKEAASLEKEFLSHEMGKDANYAMKICVIIGIITFVFSTIIISILMIINKLNPYIFTISILGILMGIIIVVSSTIEYHMKFNSWLKVTKKIIKK